MVGGCSGGMEADEQKKLNDDLVVFMRKRSETEAPRYTARLKTYVDFQQKRRRAAAARRHTEYAHAHDRHVAAKKKPNNDNELQRDRSAENNDNRAIEDDRLSKRRGGEKLTHRPRSLSRSEEPVDACRRRRRRSCRRRRRSCRRRRRSCRRRRRRSCSRRRRRRSCRRRRRRCRRRR
ncbi:protamine-like isoform X1 [Danaus plexippus]|uniref:protamine-like isoform X1 n=1 Tax=Danaus plexippus TaxID=13037 RepID=UPI002AB0AE99|nr:protamine-like isoform X1 [Danaus plexippus]